MTSPTVQELFDLTGKVAFVTGGARSPSSDKALALAQASADVAITSRSLERARDSAHKIATRTGRRAMGFVCDVRFEDQVPALVDWVVAQFGHLDVLINKASSVVSTQLGVEHHLARQDGLRGVLGVEAGYGVGISIYRAECGGFAGGTEHLAKRARSKTGLVLHTEVRTPGEAQPMRQHCLVAN